MNIEQHRLARIQDERFFICIEDGHMYQIKDIQIINNEIWIQATDGRTWKDTDVLTIHESADHYRLRSWMKQKLNIQY